MDHEPTILSYEVPRTQTSSVKPNYIVLFSSLVVGMIGPVLLVIHKVSSNTSISNTAQIGELWLILGGVATCVLALLALIDVFRACFLRVDRRRTLIICLFIFFAVLANFPIALFCVASAVSRP